MDSACIVATFKGDFKTVKREKSSCLQIGQFAIHFVQKKKKKKKRPAEKIHTGSKAMPMV